jgi:hypothetical protein
MMPYASAKQSAFMHIHHPAIAKRWDKEAHADPPPHGAHKMDPAILHAAMKSVLSDMGKHAKKAKAKRFERPPAVGAVEGGPTLLGLMGKEGNSGADIAKTGELTPEEYAELMKGQE